MRPDGAFERLVECSSMFFPSTYTDSVRARIKHALDQGKEIPEELLPGRLIMRLGPEMRAALSKLTSDITWHRPDVIRSFLK